MNVLPVLVAALVALSRRGKWVLPLGLAAALLFPKTAVVMQSAIAPLLVAILVISFLQINQSLREIWAGNIRQTLLLVLLMQVLLPIALLLVLRGVGAPLSVQAPATLVAAASCIMGGPSIVMMLNGNGAMAIRLLIASTLALPLTALPSLALLSLHPSGSLLLRTAVILTFVVLGSYAAATALRKFVFGEQTQVQRQCLDGAAALLLALIVVGLMAAIHTSWDNPQHLAITLAAAVVVNVGLQLVGLALNHLLKLNMPIVLGVMNGNRAVAIFLTALPASVYQPYLLFIACYQIPMYLTPLVGGYFYKRYRFDDC